MSLFAVVLVAGSLVGAFLVLHHLAAIKQNGDTLLAAYRRLLAANRTRSGAHSDACGLASSDEQPREN